MLLTPVRAIRAKCLDCCCGSAHEVRLCTKGPEAKIPCALYPYRLGKSPGRAKREMTPEARAAVAERLKKARLSSGGKKST